MSGLLSTIQGWAAGLGGAGLFVIALLDSSFLSFPQVNDALVIVLSTKNPERMPYYASMTVAGSLVGCLMLYAVARRGGEALLRRRMSGARVDRAMKTYQRFGLLAVIVPALLPPPVPFKVFVLLAGATMLPVWQFALAVTIGRSIRYFGQGFLAVMYGEQAMDLIRRRTTEVGIGLALVIVVGAIGYVAWKRRRS